MRNLGIVARELAAFASKCRAYGFSNDEILRINSMPLEEMRQIIGRQVDRELLTELVLSTIATEQGLAATTEDYESDARARAADRGVAVDSLMTYEDKVEVRSAQLERLTRLAVLKYLRDLQHC